MWVPLTSPGAAGEIVILAILTRLSDLLGASCVLYMFSTDASAFDAWIVTRKHDVAFGAPSWVDDTQVLH